MSSNKFTFTEAAIKRLKPDPDQQKVYWDTKTTGLGLRVSPGGTKTFFFQGRFSGKLFKRTLGKHKPEIYTAAMAKADAKKLEASAIDGIDPRKPQKELYEKAKTFGDLMTAYVDLLESQGKKSARNVKNQVSADIERAHPALWDKVATEITLDDCLLLVGSLKDAGKPRQADKLRSYIRTAYSEAINSRGNVNVPASMRELNITSNPAKDITKVKGSSNAKDRALSVSELQAYWRRLQDLPTPQKELGSLHILTGGQRQKQLSRVLWKDIDRNDPSMLILDYKGKREEPRRHKVPLLPEALQAMESIGGGGEYVFSCNGGKSPINDRYLPKISTLISNQMAEAGELEGDPFTAGTIRATIETRLMKKPYRVSSDVLAQLLSHGLGGIQQRHYQHDEFEEEKLEALHKLWRLVNNEPEPLAAVIPFDAQNRA